jgi:hypothetical protein
LIGGDDIRQAIKGVSLGLSTTHPESLQGFQVRMADDLLETISQGGDFWKNVYEPYSRNELSRDVVRLVIEKTRGITGRQLPNVARYLKAVSDNQEEHEQQKTLYRFKNFLYKTIRIVG